MLSIILTYDIALPEGLPISAAYLRVMVAECLVRERVNLDLQPSDRGFYCLRALEASIRDEDQFQHHH